MLVDVKLDISIDKRDNPSMLQTLHVLVFLILNGTAKMKLAILAFLFRGEIVQNSFVYLWEIIDKYKKALKANVFSLFSLTRP